MLRITGIVLACLFFISPAAARQSAAICVETGTVIRPSCMGQPVKAAVRIVKRTKLVRHARREHRIREVSNYGALTASIGSGIVRAASGAVAHVAAGATHAFQCVVNALESQGYPVRFMGGYARGGHIRGSLHYSGRALDINQVSRNITSPRMPGNEIEIARGCGLISGAQWAHGDSGHFQSGGYAGSGRRHYASRHHRHRYASAR